MQLKQAQTADVFPVSNTLQSQIEADWTKQKKKIANRTKQSIRGLVLFQD